tara:strand:- start:7667 stop:7927 length:261 start_codon:yes stop_codon:yes gene_type:complete
MNELRKKYKEETKQPITEKPTGNFDYFKDEYVFWLEEHLAAINYTRCCESDSEQLVLFADWLQYNGKWSLPEQQAEDFLKEQQEQN